jgi:AraC-like DNA-binding protein/ligand-binding sensor protein
MTPVSHSRRENHDLVGRLSRSKIFHDYQSAFESATGLPLELQTCGEVRHETLPGSNPFCLLLARTNQTCAACCAMQRRLEEEASLKPKTLHCFAGLCESAVPVRVGEQLIAFLKTGQILLQRPDAKQFNRVAQALIEMGTEVDLKKAEETWFATTVLTETQYESMLKLLSIFAEHLSGCANALSVEAEHAEPESVAKARALVASHLEEDLSLQRVAKAVNVSAGYFSELFHKTTGLTFIEYVTRIRVEKVKSLLMNPRLQITEIAYDTGFKSLSQFNRAFKRVCGSSPREYRLKLADGTVS